MRKLHVVGVTTDFDGLILSTRKGSKSGGFVVAIGDELLNRLAEAERLRNGDESTSASIEQVSRGDDREAGRTRPNSELTPREIQSRLRAGRSIDEVAKEARSPREWVDRFAAPILAEQASVVDLARSMTYSKSRLGQSALSLGDSVARNLATKGLRMTEDEYDDGWSAFQLHDGVWVIRFRYRSRGRIHQVGWELDVVAGGLSSRDRVASDLAYVDSRAVRRADEDEEDAGGDARPSAPAPRLTGPGARATVRRLPPAARATPSGEASAGSPDAPRRRATAVKRASAASRSGGPGGGGGKATKRAGVRSTAKTAAAKARTAAKRATPKRTSKRTTPEKRAVPTRAVKAVKATKRAAAATATKATKRAVPTRAVRAVKATKRAAAATATKASKRAVPAAAKAAAPTRAPKRTANGVSKRAATTRGGKRATPATRATTTRAGKRTGPPAGATAVSASPPQGDTPTKRVSAGALRARAAGPAARATKGTSGTPAPGASSRSRRETATPAATTTPSGARRVPGKVAAPRFGTDGSRLTSKVGSGPGGRRPTSPVVPATPAKRPPTPQPRTAQPRTAQPRAARPAVAPPTRRQTPSAAPPQQARPARPVSGPSGGGNGMQPPPLRLAPSSSAAPPESPERRLRDRLDAGRTAEPAPPRPRPEPPPASPPPRAPIFLGPPERDEDDDDFDLGVKDAFEEDAFVIRPRISAKQASELAFDEDRSRRFRVSRHNLMARPGLPTPVYY